MISVSKRYRTKVGLAVAFDTSRVSIDKWTQQPDFPGGRDGPWEHEAVAEFLAANDSRITRAERHERPGARTQVGDTRAAAEALKVREQYRKLKLQNDILEGKLRYADVIAQKWAIGMLRIRQRLQSFPDEQAMTFPESTRAQNLADFKNGINGLLREMSQWEPIDKAE